jgi:predicted RNase H-like HicB family nuclease
MANIYTAVYQQDCDWYVAWLEEIPGAMTQGKTIEQARENLQDAVRELLEARHELAERRIKL